MTACVLVLVAAGTAGLYWHTGRQGQAWIPNVATSFGTVALTLTLVEWVFRRERRRQAGAMIDFPLGHVRSELARFVVAVAEDYATTHREHFRKVPRKPAAILDLWLAEQRSADLEHMGVGPDRKTLREMGYEFAEQVEQREREVGDAMQGDLWELRAALRNFADTARYADRYRSEPSAEDRAQMPPPIAEALDPEYRSYRVFVTGARSLLDVLERDTPAPYFRKIEAWQIDEAVEARERRIRRLDERHQRRRT